MAVPDDLSAEARACLEGTSCGSCEHHLSCTTFLKGRRLHLRNKQAKTNESLKGASGMTDGQLAFKDQELTDMEQRLRDLNNGNYGFCNDCEKPIAKGRLEMLPEARRCTRCQSELEQAQGNQRFARDSSS